MLPEDIAEGRVFPPLVNIKEVSFQIGLRVADLAYAQGVATVMPEPRDKTHLVEDLIYQPDYQSYIPRTFSYPKQITRINNLFGVIVGHHERQHH